MSERRMYVEAPTTLVKPLMTHSWRVQDVNDACPEWQKTIPAAYAKFDIALKLTAKAAALTAGKRGRYTFCKRLPEETEWPFLR